MLLAAIAVVVAFLLGSIPFGVLFARARGIDLRTIGSGNIGATNAARALGKRTGLLVFLLDGGKGLAPVLVAGRLFAAHPHGPWIVAAVGFAAFLGHLFPPWLRGRGGKGVATAFGVFVALAPWPALIAGLVFALTYALTRLSSLGSLLGATAFVPALYARGGDPASLSLAGAIWLFIMIRHRDNLRRLIRGAEHKV